MASLVRGRSVAAAVAAARAVSAGVERERAGTEAEGVQRTRRRDCSDHVHEIAEKIGEDLVEIGEEVRARRRERTCALGHGLRVLV